MLTENRKLDTDTDCMVTYRFDRYNVQWILPKPEIYWQCKDPDKLIHIALITLEEMFHINQIKGNKVAIHTFGVEYDLTNEENRKLSHFVTRMMEIDVANILTTALPEMVEENWQWYADRKSKLPYENHYPLPSDFGFLLGYLLAQAMNQEKQFLTRAMTYMPEYLGKNPSAREIFFSNYRVLSQIETYLGLIYEHEGETTLTAEQITIVLNHEFSPEGMTMQFLLNCLNLRTKHGSNWLEILDKGVDESEKHETKHGTNIVNMILNFVNANPKWGDKLYGKRSIGPRGLLHRSFKNPDDMLDVLSQSYLSQHHV